MTIRDVYIKIAQKFLDLPMPKKQKNRTGRNGTGKTNKTKAAGCFRTKAQKSADKKRRKK